MPVSWLVSAAGLLIAAEAIAAPTVEQQRALASICLYNPTGWRGPAPVEVPVGHLAAPGLIEWGRVHLEVCGHEVPFAIREGRPHWRARLLAPVKQPRAEDLLVFSCAVPPGEWVRVDVVPGAPVRRSSLSRRGDRLTIAYPNLRVVIDRNTGLLQGLEAFGEGVLDAPFEVVLLAGEKRERLPSVPARLVASSSTPAMTELHFVLNAGARPEMALTYRVHACGVLEIWLDERPWEGASPWLDHSADVRLRLTGRREALPLLENRAPYYGFKDYAAAVAHPAALYRGERACVLELGEELANGRRWMRRLLFLPPETPARDAVEMADEGLVVVPQPVTVPLPSQAFCVSYPPGARAAAETLARAISASGVPAQAVPETPGARAALALRLVAGPGARGIEGDGFAVRRIGRSRIAINAATRFGLMQGALRVAEALAPAEWERDGQNLQARRPYSPDGAAPGEAGRAGVLRFPVIASNPGVALRAGGFGGGDFEVDFPYGTDAEWERVLDALIASGMNVMTDLGMWSNWKMPVSYRYMPELQSDDPDAFDEASGTPFSQIAQHRAHGLKLLNYLHERGVRVWCWLPVGCVPTTYARAHPEAMSPGSDRIPCHTHPLYLRYLQAFLTELLETYPLDGIVMIRDDNGGICGCSRCTDALAKSRTRSAAWEQYLIVYDWLRAHGFKGDVAVYPYNDRYEPALSTLLPQDLYVVGHGSGAAVLNHAYERIGPMGDTWLDNLFASFRVAPSPRMKRLLSDRGSFWIGGAYCGTELPWESVGTFGWEPTATVNTFRYRWGARHFGDQGALAYVHLSDALEHLWDLYDAPMLPHTWVKLSADERTQIARDGRQWLGLFKERLAKLRAVAGPAATGASPFTGAWGADPAAARSAWFAHVKLFGTYFGYHLRRLEAFSEMQDIVRSHREAAQTAGGLPPAERQRLIALHQEIYALAEEYDREAAAVPGQMMERTRTNQMTRPFKEWVGGYDPALEWALDVPQFSGTIEAEPLQVPAGQEFALRVRLRNTGVCPWIPGTGQHLEIAGDARRLGLPERWEYQGPALAFGDQREVVFRGIAPPGTGEAKVVLSLVSPMRNTHVCARQEVTVAWRE